MPSAHPSPLQRLLVPIAAGKESLWPIRHALQRAAAGGAIELFLAYILPPAGRGELLRFRAELRAAEQWLQRADSFLEEAALPLQAAGVPCHRFVREAEPVRGIRDLAEEWACPEALLPAPYRLDLFDGSQRRRLAELEQALRITWVREDGSPEPRLDDGRSRHAP